MNIATIILSSVVSLTNPSDTINTTTPSPIIHSTIEYDSLMCITYEELSKEAFQQYFNNFINLDSTITYKGELSDSVYAARLSSLFSPVEMAFNDIVKQRIIYYTTTGKQTMSVILGRAQYYFPMIEQELTIAGLPVELRILAAVESALQAKAYSYMGAAGLWQFMPATGKYYGLEVSTLVDERLDPVLATKAACKYLARLYKLYNNWTLALAAYNCGEGNVNKAIARVGGKDKVKSFWDVYPYLPTETRGYVPTFIGMSYAFAYHKQHNITAQSCPLPIAVDTIMVSRPIHLKQIEATLGTPLGTLQGLNPQYLDDIVPATGKSYPVMLPIADATRYISNTETIHALDSVYLADYLYPNNLSAATKELIESETIHKVKSGETLSAIARKYGVTLTQIKQWNNIKNVNSLKIGQRITIRK